MKKFIETKLIEEFKDRDSFTREELFEFFRYFEPDLKEGTFGWRIYELKNNNIIKPLVRGSYKISYKPKFKPSISLEHLKVAKKIEEKFTRVKYCIWETKWLNEFSQHQAIKRMQIIEIEKEFVEILYYHLKDSLKFDFYLRPNEKDIDVYISESNYPIIIKKLVTRSPVVKMTENRAKLAIPQLEKILVDLYSEKKIFYFYQGFELTNIFKNALTNYAINFTKLFNYARRRQKEDELKSYLSTNMKYMLKDIIDDQ